MADVSISREQFELAEHAVINGDIAALERFLVTYKGNPQIKERFVDAGVKTDNDSAENARLIMVHKHYFNNWPEFEHFKKELNREGSAISQFEQAADAIAAGDVATLERLLQQNPPLIKERSTRNHHSTLLNYVGANGFEGYRQKTPKNAVEIAEILLKAGAEVDAMGDMYRGTTTLGLVATSVHPVKTGVQEELMDVLIRYGADPNHAVAPDYTEGSLILACLANGRGEPVAYLARHGAAMDLEAMGGVGDVEKVKSYYSPGGGLREGVSTAKRDAAFIWACAYGRVKVVEFMLEQGISSATEAHGMTALHWAVAGGQLEIMKILLSRNAPLEAKNNYDGTVLGQALWFAYNDPKPHDMEIVDTLLAAGAKAEPDWVKYIDELRAG
jgi:hypothetical protein